LLDSLQKTINGDVQQDDSANSLSNCFHALPSEFENLLRTSGHRVSNNRMFSIRAAKNLSKIRDFTCMVSKYVTQIAEWMEQ